jgi:hypothetical protein
MRESRGKREKRVFFVLARFHGTLCTSLLAPMDGMPAMPAIRHLVLESRPLYRWHLFQQQGVLICRSLDATIHFVVVVVGAAMIMDSIGSAASVSLQAKRRHF